MINKINDVFDIDKLYQSFIQDDDSIINIFNNNINKQIDKMYKQIINDN